MKTIQDAIFRRAELLLGDEAMKQIAQKRVIIFGVGSFDIGSYDYIIDAIDSLKDKTLLILMATQTEATMPPAAQSNVCVQKQRQGLATLPC